jgi:type II secretory pathway predicted ATPase ExeA
MTPAAALQEQIERYCKMTGEQRLAIALDLHELACDMARAGIRHQHPGATEDEVDHLLRHRLRLAYSL